ncbi:hypothetical protein ASG51_00950 [Methylobacterium sp. Leaf465]|nr:hypothetical protein ASG51_00950 [Methylobacterium sp. Leaf465]
MEGEAPAPAEIVLAAVTVRLGLAAEGNDIPGNLDLALRTIITAAKDFDMTRASPEAIERAKIALAVVAPVATEHFGGWPQPETVDMGLSCASNIVCTFGTDPADLPQTHRDLLPIWADWAAILVAEADAVTRYRRLAAGLGRDFDAPAAAPHSVH